MPVPAVERLDESARKGIELLLRTVGEAPEQRAARVLRSQPREVQPGAPHRRVLFLSPRNWAAQVQVEAVIGHALRQRGADVHFLTCGGGLEICDRADAYEAPPMPCGSCSRYNNVSLEAHGFPLHRIRDGWEGAGDRLAWPELAASSVSSLPDARADGLPLGRLVDVPLKWFLSAADLSTDPMVGHTYRAFLRAGRQVAEGIRRALDELQPDVVVLLSGLFLFEGIAWALCRERGIDVVTYERAFRKDTLVFSRDVPAGFYDFSVDWPRVRRDLRSAEDEELDEYLAARRRGGAFDQFWEFTESTVERPAGRLVSLFTNLTWDTAVIGRDVAFPDIETWLSAAIDTIAPRPPHRLVVRVHPSELALPGKPTRDSLAAFIRRRFPRLPENVSVIGPNDLASSYPLMEASDIGLVYTSTTGLELALAGTPVVVAGETHYRGKGFTTDVASPEEFVRVLDSALHDPASLLVDVPEARRYAHFFFFRAPIPAPGVVEPLRGIARLTVRDLAELRPGADPSVDRICDGILLGESFIRPETDDRGATRS